MVNLGYRKPGGFREFGLTRLKESTAPQEKNEDWGCVVHTGSAAKGRKRKGRLLPCP